jgi:transcriptional regulator with XRE-family HTH domain
MLEQRPGIGLLPPWAPRFSWRDRWCPSAVSPARTSPTDGHPSRQTGHLAVGFSLQTRIRRQHKCTLAAPSETTGISVSTLSRLESGQRKASLELLLPIAHAHRVPLDELIGAPQVGDPRMRLKPLKRKDRTVVPLTQQPGGLQAFEKVFISTHCEPELRTHEGYEWL